jgi:hypothetical protein
MSPFLNEIQGGLHEQEAGMQLQVGGSQQVNLFYILAAAAATAGARSGRE